MSRHIIILTYIALLLDFASAAQTEYRNEIGQFESTSHQIAGTVYAVDEETIYIRGFTYDGNSTSAMFYAGTCAEPQSGGVPIPIGSDTSELTRAYQSENLMITLPQGKITDYKWISVWCEVRLESFGHVLVPADFIAPAPKSLGSLGFSRRVHNVHADDVILLNVKQIKFVRLDYDGNGPAAYFWTGDGTPDNGDIKVPHPPDKPNKILPFYSDDNVTITLPEGNFVDDVDFIGLWCIQATQDFGHISISASDVVNIPPYIEPTTTPLPPTDLPHCKVLVPDRFHITWDIDEESNKITLEFRGIIALNEYLAFGISGSTTRTLMIGSDVTVVWFDPNNNEPAAVDYNLNDQSQCIPTEGRGACPDSLQETGEDNVQLVMGFMQNGVSVIQVERPLNSPDSLDTNFTTTKDVYVTWGIGFINPTGHVAKHDIRPNGNVVVNFGESPSSCPPLKAPGDVPNTPDPWDIEPLTPECGEELIAVIGPSGGQRGYQGITGDVGWGFAWYINGWIIPEIHVKRGCSYTFLVYGGDDESELGNYHPFYISDTKDGGYAQKKSSEQSRETIYADRVEGSLCEYRSGDARPETFDNFVDYRDSLYYSCSKNATPGVIIWTVADNTPDLVYYQCYQHRFFGWKIHVSRASCSTPMTFPLLLLYVGIELLVHF